jgi:hypothetical protein
MHPQPAQGTTTMSNQDPRNSTFAPVSAFSKQMVLNTVQRDHEAERLALTYLNRKAPDLLGMIMGHIL